MKTNYKKNPRRILGYLMAFVMVFSFTSYSVAQTINIQVTPGSYANEISWELSDASGVLVASTTPGYYQFSGLPNDFYVSAPDGCYSYEMFDTWGDGWNGGSYIISDSATGTVWATGGLASGLYQLDIVGINSTCISGCMDPLANNYDSLANMTGACSYVCIGNEVTLTMGDSFGDGWNGNVWNMYDLSGAVVATGTLLTGSTGTETFCIPDGCYTMDCGVNPVGSWQNEVSWQLTDTSGTVLASGGAPWSGNINLNSTCSAGCTDPFASNYDSTAIFDDGSCLYPGCLDPMALNYCAACNVNDSLSCIFPVCNTPDFNEDFESNNLGTNDWTNLSGSESLVALTTANAIADTVSLEFTGGSFTGWTGYTTEVQAYANTDHVSSATLCMDLSASPSNVNLQFLARATSVFTNVGYSWIRVKVGGVVIADALGNTAYNNGDISASTILDYDLSAYSGQSQVYVTFEASCKYGPVYSGGAYNCNVQVDDINIVNVYPCTFYAASVVGNDVAGCYGDSTGSATVTVSSPYTTNDTYLWSDGQTTATAIGLSAGTYTCTTTDSINGCMDTVSVTIGEPSDITLSASIMNATSPIANNGSVDLSVSGGTPCITSDDLITPVAGGNGQSGCAFNVVNTSGGPLDITGFSQGGTYILTAAVMEVYMYAGDIYASGLPTGSPPYGWTLVGSAAVTTTGGNSLGLIPVTGVTIPTGGTYSFRVQNTSGTVSYTNGAGVPGVSAWASDANVTITEGHGGSLASWFSFVPRNFNGAIHYGSPGASAYTFVWNNGATTEDVDSLPMGPVSVSVEDCNGCVATWSGFVVASIDLGCTDPLAQNFDPMANTDDGSCLYPGCTDSLANNFDPTANLNDSSCTYSCAYQGLNELTIVTNGFQWIGEVSWNVVGSNGISVASGSGFTFNGDSAGVETVCAADDCYTLYMYDSFGDSWNGCNVDIYDNGVHVGNYTVAGAWGTPAGLGDTAMFTIGTANPCMISGCTDSLAINYDPQANIDDGSCITCLDNELTLNMVDSWGDGWNGNTWFIQDISTGTVTAFATLLNGSAGSETFCVPDGCYSMVCGSGIFQGEVSWTLTNDTGAVLASGGAPYSSNFTLGAAVCVSGCMDATACNYDPSAVFDDGSCDFSCYGCTDSTAYNYDPTTTVDDGSCMYCAVTASAVAFDAADSTSASGSVDLTLTGSNCSSGDTVYAGAHGSNYTSSFTRGYYFQAQSSFSIMGVHASDGNTGGVGATSQSVEIVDFGTTMPVAFPGPGSPHTVLYSAIDAGPGWLATGNVSIVAGNYYGVIGAKHNTALTTMYNSYVSSPSVTIDGMATQLNRIVLQSSLAAGSPQSGAYMAEAPGTGSIGRVDIMTGTGLINATFAWSNGDTTEDLSAVSYGAYSVTGVDCNGCTFSASAYVGVTPIPGCMDPTAFNYDSLANIDDGSCIPVILGCIDPTAANYDSTANTDDGTCHYCFGSYSVTIECTTNPWPTEVSWDLLDASGTIILSGGAPYINDTCLDGGCYTLNMYDSFGDGWNGSVFSITENVSGTSVSAGLASGSMGSASLSSASIGCFIYGCTDPMATNYDPTANADDGSCTYPSCYGITFNEDWEAGLASQDWLISAPGITPVGYQGSYSELDTITPIAGWGSFHAVGGDGYSGWGPYSTEAGAFSNTSHVQSANICIDLTGVTAPAAMLDFDYQTQSGFSNTAPGLSGSAYSTLRVSVDGTVLTDMNGVSWHGEEVLTHLQYDMTSYIGQTVNVVFETACKYNINYNPLYGDNVWVDNIVIDGANPVIWGCTDVTANNFNPAATNDDGSCTYPCADANSGYATGFEDGIATIGLNPADWSNNVDDNTNNNANYGDWIHDAGGTGSSNTGPNYSTNYGGSGYAMEGSYYMYIETSGNYLNDVSMTSHCFDISTLANPTLKFWYNMYGVAMGSLNVELSSDEGATWDSTWTASGDQGTEWHEAVIDVSAYAATSLTIKITGITGTSYTSDMCVDQVSISDGYSVPGCMDPNATNYDSLATVDNGSCTYSCAYLGLDEVTITLYDSWGDGWNGNSLTVDGVNYTLTGGTTESFTACVDLDSCIDVAYNYTGQYPYENSWAIYSGGVVVLSGNNASASAPYDQDDGTFGTCSAPVSGCTDPLASNYDPLAVVDDGSCCYGSTVDITCGGGAYQGEVSWTLSNSAGAVILIGGAPYASTECLPDDCYTVDMVDSWGDGWNGNMWDASVGGVSIASGTLPSGSTGSFTFATGSAVCAVSGCTDPLASNYDSTATVDDGSCLYPCLLDEVTLTLYDSWGDGWNGNSLTIGGVDYTIAGFLSAESFTLCVDLSMCDTATYNPTGFYQSENSWDIVDASGTTIASGNDNSATFGNCSVIVDGCTDSTALNYNPLANNDDGSCVYCVYGCTDSVSVNYNASATCDDGSCIAPVYGCMDPLATNYYAGANIDDGSCTYAPSTCTNPSPTNAYITELIHDRARVNWDNMNDANCMVEQYRIRYREAGTSTWSSKTMAGSGLCVFGLNTTSKKILGLTPSTTYEYYMKAWYCGGGTSGWSAIQNFTTGDECPGVINFGVTTPTTTKATFAWDTTAAYSFARIKLRPDTTGGAWTTAGGFGVFYPLLSKTKNGLTPGQTYRASSRTWCDPTGGAYRSAGWTSPIFWTQPTSIRLEGGTAINNLDVYPNPSRDIFNVSFTSEDAQDLEVRIINVVGEVVYTESLEQFVGEYTQQVTLATYTKGVYFLEITTNNGVVNKKLILQ